MRPAAPLEADLRDGAASPEELNLACTLIDSVSGPLDWTRLRDDTPEKLMQLIEAKLEGPPDGTTPDTEYSQLNVAGAVNLTGAALALSGSYTPVVGDAFTIVANDASDPVAGTFAGLPEGAIIADFLGSGLNAIITYVGGDGNDVVLHVGDDTGAFAINDVQKLVVRIERLGGDGQHRFEAWDHADLRFRVWAGMSEEPFLPVVCATLRRKRATYILLNVDAA